MRTKTLVIGLGLTGLSLARHAARAGDSIKVWDTRIAPPMLDQLQLELPDARFNQLADYADVGKQVAKFDKILISSGVALPALQLPNQTTNAYGDLECFMQSFVSAWSLRKTQRPKLVLITGTNGKSTCCELTASRLNSLGNRAQAVGNIGLPLLDAFATWEQTEWPEFIIAEVSSYQLALRHSTGADFACLLNYAADHIEWHQNEQAYLQAKLSVYQQANIAIFNSDDEQSSLGAKTVKHTLAFGKHNHQAKQWSADPNYLQRLDSDLQYSSKDLLAAGIFPANVAAALTIVDACLGQANDDQLEGWLAKQHGLNHRLEFVTNHQQIRYIDDSKATNEAATCAALTALGTNGTILIAGGQAKQENFSKLKLAAESLSGLVLIGQATKLLETTFADAKFPVQSATSMQQSVSLARELAKQTHAERVLLSPACASFDMFANYAARGDEFSQAVKQTIPAKVDHVA